jgi:cytidylate kinase
VLAEQTIRDQRDRTRAQAPLEPAPDAVLLDTTELTPEEAVARVAELVRAARPR